MSNRRSWDFFHVPRGQDGARKRDVAACIGAPNVDVGTETPYILTGECVQVFQAALFIEHRGFVIAADLEPADEPVVHVWQTHAKRVL